MKTVEELVKELKCRKGPADGTTKRGAFWHAIKTPKYSSSSELVNGVMIRSYGGDGVGQNRPDMTAFLELRHYRSGEVSASVREHSWHQNSGASDRWIRMNYVLGCTTVEDVVVALKGADEVVYSDNYKDELTKVLTGIGLAESEPAPDEV